MLLATGASVIAATNGSFTATCLLSRYPYTTVIFVACLPHLLFIVVVVVISADFVTFVRVHLFYPTSFVCL